MFNIRVNLIIALVVFFLSLTIGLLIRSSLPFLIIRPVIFAVIALFLSLIINLLINHFLPELLEQSTPESDEIMSFSGANINISEDTAVIPEGLYAKPDDSDDSIGNISDIASAVSGSSDFTPVSMGLDQSEQDGYNIGEQEYVRESEGAFDGLPDLESLAGAFMPGSAGREDERVEYQTSDTPARTVIGNKAQKMDVDFDPKDLAMGLRTILNKQEG